MMAISSPVVFMRERVEGEATRRTKRRPVNYRETEFRIKLSRVENPKNLGKLSIQATSGDDVISGDKASKASTANRRLNIKKREYDSRNSFSQAF